jgi:hypothetical protein
MILVMARPRSDERTLSQEEFETELETALTALNRAENVFTDVESNIAQFLLELGLSRQAFLRMVPYITDSLPDIPTTSEEDVYRIYQERKRLRTELQGLQQEVSHMDGELLVEQTSALNTNDK